mgnify:CR=1 FL=1
MHLIIPYDNFATIPTVTSGSAVYTLNDTITPPTGYTNGIVVGLYPLTGDAVGNQIDLHYQKNATRMTIIANKSVSNVVIKAIISWSK